MKIGIAGAGLLGRLLAWELLQKGCEVTLFDKDSGDGRFSCGLTAAGMLSPLAEIETAHSVIFDKGLQSLSLWPGILKSLDDNVDYQQTGSLLMAHGQDQGELERFIQILSRKIDVEQYIQSLDKQDCEAIEPALNMKGNVYYFPLEGQINTTQLFSALYNALQHDKVTWKNECEVLALDAGTIVTHKKHYTFDCVFDCRGLGAKVDTPALRGVRGELIWVHAPDVKFNRPIRLMHPRYRLYVVPRADDVYLIGASEIESEDHSPISVRTTLELLSAAYSLHSGFAEARIIKTAVNCRPAFPDNLPRVEIAKGLVRMNGLYRHGYLLAPALIADVLEKIDLKEGALC